MSNLSRKKIAFFAYETRSLDTYPTILNLTKILVASGYQVDIYIPPDMSIHSRDENIRILVTSQQTGFSYVHDVVEKIKANHVKYDLLFAFYFEGLVIAEQVNREQYIPTVYFSMELIYENLQSYHTKKILNPVGLLSFLVDKFIPFKLNDRILNASKNYAGSLEYLSSLKRLKRDGQTFIQFGIAQDKNRASILKEQFTFINKTYLLPNSYIGFESKKSDYIYKRYGVSNSKKILLYVGVMEKGFDMTLLDLYKNLDADYLLFFNVFSRDGYDKELVEKYKQAIQSKKIIIESQILEEEEFDQLVRSSYIGLCWYSDPGKDDLNMYYLGLSSGKLCKFLSCGIPVITPDHFYGYKPLIDDRLGYTSHNTSKIPESIVKINREYSGLQKQIQSYYQSNLEFSQQAQVVVKALSEL